MNPVWSLGSPAFTFVSLTHTVFQQHLNMHICLSNKNENSLFIFSTDVQNKLPYLAGNTVYSIRLVIRVVLALLYVCILVFR